MKEIQNHYPGRLQIIEGDAIEIQQEKYFTIKTFTQTGKGKANAVWEAMEKIDSEVVAILDADISVDPETIPDFFEIIDKNNADFVVWDDS